MNDRPIPAIQLRSGYEVSRVAIGCWQLSGGHSGSAIDRDELYAAYDRLIDLGVNTFDCADIYTGVEEFLGGYLARRRSRYGDAGADGVKIHTKFVPDLQSLATITSRDVERIVDRSRARLGVDRLDLVQFAWWDYGVARYVEVGLCLAELAQQNKIHHIGATNFDHVRLAELVNAGVPIALHQVQYSVLDQRPRNDMTRVCEERDIWLACYGVLAGGFLTDRYRGAAEAREPFENRSLRKYKLIIDEFGGWQRLQACLTTLHDIAAKHGVTVASVATRFILDRRRVAAAILGIRSPAHVQRIPQIFQFDLDDHDYETIHHLVRHAPGPHGKVFELERDRESLHGRIMKYNLNADGAPC